MDTPTKSDTTFPFSLPVYASGGIFVEIVPLLVPTVFLVWITANVLLHGARPSQPASPSLPET